MTTRQLVLLGLVLAGLMVLVLICVSVLLLHT
jgi:hypothetical protein